MQLVLTIYKGLRDLLLSYSQKPRWVFQEDLEARNIWRDRELQAAIENSEDPFLTTILRDKGGVDKSRVSPLIYLITFLKSETILN